MFKIIESYTIVPNIHILTVEAQHIVPNLRVGNFIILRVEEDGERIPLTPADWDIAAGTITFAVMIVGRTTRKLSHLKPGDFIPTVSGPLGNPMPIEHFGKVLCIGGCYGNGSLFPLCRALKQQQNKVYAVVEARSAQLIFWEDKLKSVTDKLYFITRDGSRGYQGHVAENLPKIINEMGNSIDLVIANGCNYMMKRTCDATQSFEIKTLVSLNTIMMDGTGMCGVCRLTMGDKTKFACVDGPYFDGHLIDWVELAKRRQSYIVEEARPLRSSRATPRPQLLKLPQKS